MKMALNRFAKEARLVVGDSIRVARDLGAPSVEAEHLLLAVAKCDAPVARVLSEAGLDFDGLTAALAAETTRSLAAVGVSADALQFSPFVERPRLATSAKLALERALRAAAATSARQIASKHVALGALRAANGTVPRALECAGVDRVELTQRVEAL
jgi:ATP-dependent Clp protease ATP-binding subunit ClpA